MSARQSSAAVFTAAVLAAALASASSASKQRSPVVKGGSYTGTLAAPRTAFAITFKVSKSGKQVTSLKINNLPFYCPGGGMPVPISFANAKISKTFTFSSTGVQTIKVGPLKGHKGATLTLTGKFSAGRKESGRITTKFPSRASASCNGASSYSTHA